MNDLRYAARMLFKAPLPAAAVVLTLALGIGANTAIFSVVNSVLLRPLPFSEPDRLVWVAERNDKLSLPTFAASALNYLSWRETTRTLEPLGAIGFASFNLTGDGEPEQLSGGTLTSSIFPLLGLHAVVGRAFQDDEDRPGAPLVAMVSEGLWKRRFGGDTSLIGRTVALNGLDYLVVGVAPPALALIASGDVYVPLTIDPRQEKRLNHVTTVVGRLKPGIDLDGAQAEMDTVARRVGRDYPEVADWGIRLVTFPRWLVPDQLRTALLVLLGAVACVLLIACATVANLLLARGVAREKEMAVRTALGASGGRLMRQLLVESLLLSLAGGGGGLLAASWAVHLFNAGMPANSLPVPEVRIDGAVLFFALAVSVVTGLLFGVAPGWRAARTEANAVLKKTGRSATGGARPLLRNALVVAELALATVLLVGAGLLVQTLRQLGRVDLGFRPEGLLTFQLSLPPAQYPLDGRAFGFYRELLESLRSLPGVREAAISSGVPFGVGNYTATPVSTVGKSVLPAGTAVTVDWRLVSPGYFRTMGIPVLGGRTFSDSDDASGPPVIIVSHLTAEKFWGTDDPVGRTIHRVADGREFTVVGVVGDTHNTALNQQSLTMYFSSAARLWPLTDVVVRVDGKPESVLSGVRQRVRELDRGLPISNVRTMEEWVRTSTAQPRLDAALLAAFAGLALLIAAVGTYSVVAYSVSQRTAEIGLRLALGARPDQVVRLFLGEGMVLGLTGIGGGLIGALALTRALSSLVFGVAARDPGIFGVVTIAVAAIALLACALPARRASRVDPMVALREE